MRLKEMRTNKGLLQRDVAEVLSCSTPVYCRYEKGEREPPFDIIKKLADFYGVTVDYLMGRDAPQSNPNMIYAEYDLGHAETKVAPADERAEAKRLLEGMSDEQYQAALQYLKLLKTIK